MWDCPTFSPFSFLQHSLKVQLTSSNCDLLSFCSSCARVPWVSEASNLTSHFRLNLYYSWTSEAKGPSAFQLSLFSPSLHFLISDLMHAWVLLTNPSFLDFLSWTVGLKYFWWGWQLWEKFLDFGSSWLWALLDSDTMLKLLMGL